MKNFNFAVYVDAENVSHNLYELALSQIAERGSISIKNVYADWSISCYKPWKTVLQETLSSAKQQFHYGNNDVDNAIIMDAIELAITNNNINAIALMSSDGGYFSLAQRLRERGIYVITLGNNSTPDRLRSSCHEFITLDVHLLQQYSLNNKELETLFIEAYQKNTVQQEYVLLSTFGTIIRNIKPSFDVNRNGYKSLKKLLDAHPLFYVVKSKEHGWLVKIKQKTSVFKLASYLHH